MTRTSERCIWLRRSATRETAAVAVALMGLTMCGPSADSASAKTVRVQPTSASSSFVPAAVRDRMLAQRPLREAAGDIRAVVEQGRAPDFAGMVIRDGGLVVYRKGAPSAGLTSEVTEARETMTVTVESAAHSFSELEAAADAVAEHLRANPTSPIHSIDVPVDGSGLVLAADGAVDPSDVPTAPVPVKVVQRPRIMLTSRLADTAPFWGGARITNADTGGSCTSGFGVRRDGISYMLTAGHCGRIFGGLFNGNYSAWIGAASFENDAHDLLLVRANVGGRIYDGPVGVGEFSKAVAGWGWTTPGEYLCHSGSRSGVVCHIRNTNNMAHTMCDTDAYGVRQCYSDLVLAERVNGMTAALPGDSGGPVFGLAHDPNRVIAKGTITGAGGKWLTYQDFGTAVLDFGVVPIIG